MHLIVSSPPSPRRFCRDLFPTMFHHVELPALSHRTIVADANAGVSDGRRESGFAEKAFLWGPKASAMQGRRFRTLAQAGLESLALNSVTSPSSSVLETASMVWINGTSHGIHARTRIIPAARWHQQFIAKIRQGTSRVNPWGGRTCEKCDMQTSVTVKPLFGIEQSAVCAVPDFPAPPPPLPLREEFSTIPHASRSSPPVSSRKPSAGTPHADLYRWLFPGRCSRAAPPG